MRATIALIVAPDPRLAQWQLPLLRSGRTMLLGWRAPTAEFEDSSVPEPITAVIAKALTRVARVTFPTSTRPNVAPPAMVDVLETRGVLERLEAWRSRTPAAIYLVSTRNPQSLRMLFDDGGFPWWMQGNVALLSHPDDKPVIDRSRLLAIMNLDAIDSLVIESKDLWGILVPGVDGDVAGLFTRDMTLQALLVNALEGEAQAASFEWIVTTEEQFADHLRPDGPA